jgi:hypothetical protein
MKMINKRNMEPTVRTLAFIAAVLAALWSASAVAQQDLGDLYGSQNIQTVTGRYGVLLSPDGGSSGELMFGFNTLAKRSEGSETYQFYYGVELGGSGFSISDANLGKYDERDTAGGYGLLQLEFKLFATGKGPVRPYLGGALGYGTGLLWAEHIRGEDDVPDSLNVYALGVEAGLHFPLDNGYGLVTAVAADARIAQFSGDTLALYPAMFTIGICKWMGPL